MLITNRRDYIKAIIYIALFFCVLILLGGAGRNCRTFYSDESRNVIKGVPGNNCGLVGYIGDKYPYVITAIMAFAGLAIIVLGVKQYKQNKLLSFLLGIFGIAILFLGSYTTVDYLFIKR